MTVLRKAAFCQLALSVWLACCDGVSRAGESVTLNTRDTGYRGIWYQNQPLENEYRFKYSGGLGTYCAKHQPFAVYCPDVEKTFFCYGGVPQSYHKKHDLTRNRIGALKTREALYHMVSYYDHKTGEVPRPVVLLDKKTYDAHDNPVIAVDRSGYLWIFSTSHGTSRPSYIHRSAKPYDISRFARINATQSTVRGPVPVTNFSYMQVWTMSDGGFVYFFTRYEGGRRVLRFSESADGVNWSQWQRLASIEEGQYQISGVHKGLAASTFNMHPQGKGLNWRTNLYYLETPDRGKSWRTVDGTPVTLPLTRKHNPTLVHDYQREGLLVYLKDLTFDEAGRPVILFLTSRGYASGPKNQPRTWRVARWTGQTWLITAIAESDNNYDMGSLYAEQNGRLCVIAPTEIGPQPFNPGGEVAMWSSSDGGDTWRRVRWLTCNSLYNHTYVRRPVRAHADFYAFWADGHGREPSPSRLYFATRDGRVFRLPTSMTKETARPELVPIEPGE